MLQLPILDVLDLPSFTDEIKKAILLMDSNKPAGQDSIPAEIYKALDPNALWVFQDILKDICLTKALTVASMKIREANALIVALLKIREANQMEETAGYLTAVHCRQNFFCILLNRLVTV